MKEKIYSIMQRRHVLIWIAYVGGGIFFILNLLTNCVAPGGFVGGVLGVIILYCLTWVILQFLPPVKSDEN